MAACSCSRNNPQKISSFAFALSWTLEYFGTWGFFLYHIYCTQNRMVSKVSALGMRFRFRARPEWQRICLLSGCVSRSQIKKLFVGTGRAGNFDVPNYIQLGRIFGLQWHRCFLMHLFVANVFKNDGALNVNVNKFSNDNVWNASNGNVFVFPKHTVSPSQSFTALREFLFWPPFLSSIRRSFDRLPQVAQTGRHTSRSECTYFPKRAEGRILLHRVLRWLLRDE